MNKTQAKLPFLKFALIPCLIPAMLVSLAADTLTWTGDAGNGNWSNTDNWSPAQAPAAGDSLIFNNNVQTTQTATIVALTDLTWGTSAGVFNISGGSLTLNQSGGGLFNNSGLSQTLGSPLILGGGTTDTQTIDAGTGGFVLGGGTTIIRFRRSTTFNGTGGTSISGNLQLRNSPTFTISEGTVALHSTLSDETATANTLGKAGEGTLELLAANTFGGNFFLNGGTVVAGNNGAFGLGSFLVGSSGGTVGTLRSVNGEDRTFPNNVTLQRTLHVEGGGVLTFDGDSGNFGSSPLVIIEAGTTLRVNSDMSGTSLVTKQGDGAFILAGDNSGHSGSITSQAGLLELVNSTGTGAGTGNLTLFAGATLAGDGLSGNSAVTMNGTLSPGANGGQDEGTLTFNPTAGNKVAFGSTSRLELQSGDRIAFDSAGDWLSFASGAELHLLESSWLTGWNTFVLNIDTLPDNIASNLSLSQASIDAGFALDTITPFRIDGTDLQLNLTAIPEARTVLFVLTMVAGALLLRRRRA